MGLSALKKLMDIRWIANLQSSSITIFQRHIHTWNGTKNFTNTNVLMNE